MGTFLPSLCVSKLLSPVPISLFKILPGRTPARGNLPFFSQCPQRLHLYCLQDSLTSCYRSLTFMSNLIIRGPTSSGQHLSLTPFPVSRFLVLCRSKRQSHCNLARFSKLALKNKIHDQQKCHSKPLIFPRIFDIS